MIPLQVEILTRNPERIGLKGDTLTHTRQEWTLSGIFCEECQAGKHGGALGRGVQAIGIR